eukprot:COSAG05_NODE_2555_length_2910_cov_2.355034_3_plen_95_part_00
MAASAVDPPLGSSGSGYSLVNLRSVAAGRIKVLQQLQAKGDAAAGFSVSTKALDCVREVYAVYQRGKGHEPEPEPEPELEPEPEPESRWWWESA